MIKIQIFLPYRQGLIIKHTWTAVASATRLVTVLIDDRSAMIGYFTLQSLLGWHTAKDLAFIAFVDSTEWPVLEQKIVENDDDGPTCKNPELQSEIVLSWKLLWKLKVGRHRQTDKDSLNNLAHLTPSTHHGRTMTDSDAGRLRDNRRAGRAGGVGSRTSVRGLLALCDPIYRMDSGLINFFK
jgi:hypothetical protein